MGRGRRGRGLGEGLLQVCLFWGGGLLCRDLFSMAFKGCLNFWKLFRDLSSCRDASRLLVED